MRKTDLRLGPAGDRARQAEVDEVDARERLVDAWLASTGVPVEDAVLCTYVDVNGVSRTWVERKGSDFSKFVFPREEKK